MVPWVLASQSPRRQSLLRLFGQAFQVHPAQIEERLPATTRTPAKVAKQLALAKAEAVAPDYNDALIIAADTIVVLDNTILGKPTDADDARRLLRMLSGRTHTVITALCLILRQQGQTVRQVLDAPRSRVTFRTLTEDWIEWYLHTGEPFDKAGAYGIQEYGALLVERVQGCYFNVVGLPLATLSLHLEALVGWHPAIGTPTEI